MACLQDGCRFQPGDFDLRGGEVAQRVSAPPVLFLNFREEAGGALLDRLHGHAVCSLRAVY